MALIIHVFSGAHSHFPMAKSQKKGHVPPPPRESDCLVTADTYTSIFGLRVSPEVVNTVSQSGFGFKALWVLYVASLWSWMFRVLLKSKFCSRSLWHGLGDAWSRSLLAIPSLRSGCGASWASGWCRNCGWEQASSLLPPHRGTWKGSEG